ncbi:MULTISPECIES: DUF5819 family protein [Streptomyces]|uniref:DUF5819 family protein n=1 Tax=Streptomyces TaxID=1883 RepID=UPI000AD8D72F|nr:MULTISPECIES: DUF5819 family protein [Streptomyces]MCX5172185.1 DUF5819 family protein [Streptomyces antibioticus]NUV59725.1 hypothetical protein [Streptomyces sp. CAI-85]
MTEQYRVVRRAVLLTGAALLGVHFTMTALSQAPLSPAKVRYQETVNAYMQPYFAQTWLLFAPDPLTDDRGIVARARCADNTVTKDYDVTTPYIKDVQDSRFFPSRMSRLVTGPVQEINNSDELLNRLRNDSQNDKKPLLPLMPHEKRSQSATVTYLSRYSLTQMPQACDGDVQAVQVRMYIHQLPPWSKRNAPEGATDEGKVEVYDFPWRKASALR